VPGFALLLFAKLEVKLQLFLELALELTAMEEHCDTPSYFRRQAHGSSP
jgi:hypothetical protein